MKTLDHYLHTAIIYTFYFFFLALPLIWYPSLSELFEFPKMVFVYTATIILLTLWTARMIIAKKILLVRTPLDLPLLLFLASQLLSTIFSIDRHTSLFGYYSRFHGGLLSTLSYTSLFYLFVANFDPDRARTALRFILGGALVGSLYALPEHFGYSPSCLAVAGQLSVDCWQQDVQTRIYGTFGQPNWLAAYLVMLLPLLWWQLTNGKLTKLGTAANLLCQTLLFSVLIFTRSRSGLLGLAVAFGLFWFISLIRTHHKQAAKPLLITAAVLALIAGYFGTEFTPSLSQLVSRFGSQPVTQESQAPTTSGTVLETGGTESGKIREIVWGGAIEVFKHHPITGTGVETFAYSYYNFRPLAHNLVSEWDFLYNKAHNEFLNFAATTGFLGLGSYLFLIGAYLFFSFRTTSSKDSDLLPAALACGFIALVISNFFGFSTVAVTVLFFIFPAIYLIYTHQVSGFLPTTPTTLTQRERRKLKNQPNSLSVYDYTAFGTITIVALFFLYKNVNYLRADLFYSAAQKYEQGNQLGLSLQSYQQAVGLSPDEPMYHNDFADTLSKAALAQASTGSDQTTQQLAQRAFQESATTLQQNSRHINFYKTQAGVYIRLATIDPSLLNFARSIIEQSLTLAPTDAKLTYNLGLIYTDLNNLDLAQQYLERTVDMKSNYEAARMQLAALYVQNQHYDQAREQYQYILNYIAPGNAKAQEALNALPQD